ncbi:MAG: glycosyltransferase, partial [Planctomycetota bacterium]
MAENLTIPPNQPGMVADGSASKFDSISFVIPAHNEANFIGPTLTALTDTVEELNLDSEIIVVADGCTDSTVDIARGFECKVVEVNHRNIGAVRNAGARSAVHDWLFFLDADTQVPTETLRSALQFLADGGAGGGARVAMDVPEPLPWIKWCMYYAVSTFWQTLGGWAAGCFMFCRRKDFLGFGGFDEQYFAAEEYFFSQQVKKLGRFKLVKEPVITSARKLYKYSTFELIRFILSGIFLGGGL